jgi:hypothetical protein
MQPLFKWTFEERIHNTQYGFLQGAWNSSPSGWIANFRAVRLVDTRDSRALVGGIPYLFGKALSE